MKNLMKLTLVLSLFASVALADGDMGSGNRTCPPEGCPPPSAAPAAGDVDETILVVTSTAVEEAVDFVSDALGIF